MSIIAFSRLSPVENPEVHRFCENIWIDRKGDCVTVLEVILSNVTHPAPLTGFKLYIAGQVEALVTSNELYDNAQYCNWYYSRKGYSQISEAPKIVRGDDTEFQIVDAEIEAHYIAERHITAITLLFNAPLVTERAGITLRFEQRRYAKSYGHQWTVDERIYDRKSLLSHPVPIQHHIDEAQILRFLQGYVWIILPRKKIVGTVAPQPRNLRHLEEEGLVMLGKKAPSKLGLRMMVHWRTDAADAAWDAKRLSAVYYDQPLPYWMTWGGFAIAVLSIIFSVWTLLHPAGPVHIGGLQASSAASATPSQAISPTPASMPKEGSPVNAVPTPTAQPKPSP